MDLYHSQYSKYIKTPLPVFRILNLLELKSKILATFVNNVNNLFLMSIEIMFYMSCRLRFYYVSFIQTFI